MSPIHVVINSLMRNSETSQPTRLLSGSSGMSTAAQMLMMVLSYLSTIDIYSVQLEKKYFLFHAKQPSPVEQQHPNWKRNSINAIG